MVPQGGPETVGCISTEWSRHSSETSRFRSLGPALIEAQQKKIALEHAIEVAFGWEELAVSVEETQPLAAPLDRSSSA
jgi:hypothetical protein